MCENTISSLPFFRDRRQSGQSSWGVGQTWKEMPVIIHVPKPKICQCRSKMALRSINITCMTDLQGQTVTQTHCATMKIKTTHFSLKISFSCSVQTFMNCRALYTFIGSSIRPFMLINFTRLCSESYIMGGMTDSCLICFSLFCGRWTGKVATVTPIKKNKPFFCLWKSAPCLCDLCRLYVFRTK